MTKQTTEVYMRSACPSLQLIASKHRKNVAINIIEAMKTYIIQRASLSTKLPCLEFDLGQGSNCSSKWQIFFSWFFQ